MKNKKFPKRGKIFFVMVLMTGLIFFGKAGAGEFKDTPFFSGLPNYKITEANDQDFSDYRFFTGKNCVTVEGEKFFRAYTLKEGAKQAGDLQISRNYLNTVRGMGGQIVFDGECSGFQCAENCGGRLLTAKILKNDRELWLEIAPFNDGNDFYLTLVAKEAMKQEVTANDILAALNRDGHIALYILFDTGKSTIKPESISIIEQITQMLKNNPSLKIQIAGHTDNVGNPQSNKTLSNDRAKAVSAAVTSRGIDSSRLTAVGYGQDKPVADNKTEEGRAKNRRVELVKK
jgi:outer membrane protein OmpA-like peptidoglycan-associated protein